MTDLKWFEWNQNNSGGSFVVDKFLSHRVYIEANTLEEAELKAFDMGIYYNGCKTGEDCKCCGDRWYRPWSEEADFSIDHVQELADKYGWTEPDARLYYANGNVVEIFSKKIK